MSRSKAQRKAARRQAVDRAERIGPTPETAAKLIPSPIEVMYQAGMIDTATKNAALELADVYVAVYGAQMPGAKGAGGHHELSDEIAWKHTHRFLPWSRRWNNVRFRVSQAVIDIVIFHQPMPLTQIAEALADYASISRANPLPAPDRLAIICA